MISTAVQSLVQPKQSMECTSSVSSDMNLKAVPTDNSNLKASLNSIQTSDEQPKLTIQQIDPSIAVRPLNRERAITYLRDVVQKSGSNEDPVQIEAKIFESSKSILYEYINALCHKRVLLENAYKRNQENTPNQSPSRKRKQDELALSLPTPKKHKTTPYFQWFYNEDENSSIKLSIADNEVLENHFLTGPSVFSHQFEFESRALQVNVEEKSVEGGKSISRKLFVLERELIAPDFWTPKQSNIFHSFDLDPSTSDKYKMISKLFQERLPNASICFIRQLQHIINYQRYSFERTRVLLMGDFINNESDGEKLLFFGSKKTVPRTIILDRDGFDCLNANNTAHFYEDPYLADQDAFVIVNAQTRAQNCQKKQLIVALVAHGNSKEIIEPELNLKRPPLKHTVNGMDQIYDSTYRTRTENGYTSTEYLIQNKFQAYAAFLVDYNIPNSCSNS